MKVHTLSNGKVSLVISPENSMEEEVLKQLMRQGNEITEIRNGVSFLDTTVSQGIVIGPTTITDVPSEPPSSDEG